MTHEAQEMSGNVIPVLPGARSPRRQRYKARNQPFKHVFAEQSSHNLGVNQTQVTMAPASDLHAKAAVHPPCMAAAPQV